MRLAPLLCIFLFRIGTKTEFNYELEKYEVSEIRWIKLKRVVSVLPQVDQVDIDVAIIQQNKSRKEY